MLISLAINNANSIGQLELVSEKTKVDITFFGHKYVYSEDYEGVASLNTMVKKVIDIFRDIRFKKMSKEEEDYYNSKENTDIPFSENYNNSTRVLRLTPKCKMFYSKTSVLRKRIEKLYSDSDEKLEKANYITQICFFIRITFERLTSDGFFTVRERWNPRPWYKISFFSLPK